MRFVVIVILCMLISCKSSSAAVSHLPYSPLVILPTRKPIPQPNPYPPTNLAPAGTVDTAVIVGVVVAVVIVILLLILAIFIIVLVYMKRRDTSESRGGRRLEVTGWEGAEYRMQ